MNEIYEARIMKSNNQNYKKRYNLDRNQMMSYAQNGEDVVIQRVFQKKQGFYIDIGAADPIIDSVTKYFYDQGWNGINIEPIHKNYSDLLKFRPKDINLNIGIGEKNDSLIFYEFQKISGWSTFSEKVALIHKLNGNTFTKKKIIIKTLAEICNQYVKTEIDFLKIDVEGFEENIIRGGNWLKYRPTVLIIESDKPKRLIPILSKINYIFSLNDGLNLFFVKKEKQNLQELLSISANVCDHFIPYYYVNEIKKYNDELNRYKIELNKYRNEYSKLEDLFKKQGLDYENKISSLSNVSKSNNVNIRQIYLNLKNRLLSLLHVRK